MVEPAGQLTLRDFDSLADRLKLARQGDRRPAVIVEGVTDRRVLKRLFPELDLAYYVAGGRDRALEAVAHTRDLEVDRVTCVVDRDYDDAVEGAEARGLPVVAYDNADLESMIWHSPALPDVLEELASSEKLDAFGGVEALRSAAVHVLEPWLNLRRANALHGWGLDFHSVDIANKIDKKTLSLKVQSICDAVWTEDVPVSLATIYDAATEDEYRAECPASGLRLVRGRDALAVASAALRRLIGSLSQKECSVDQLEKGLRLAVSVGHLSETRWLDQFRSSVGAAS